MAISFQVIQIFLSQHNTDPQDPGRSDGHPGHRIEAMILPEYQPGVRQYCW